MTGRRRPTLIREQERDDILTLQAAGYTIAKIANMVDRAEASVARVLNEQKVQLRGEYEKGLLGSYMVATTVAAEKGDHRPALEMLDRLGAIPETSRQRTALATAQIVADAQHAMVANGAGRGGASGPTINIGVALPQQLASSGSFSHELPTILSSNPGIMGQNQHALQGKAIEVVANKDE